MSRLNIKTVIICILTITTFFVVQKIVEHNYDQQIMEEYMKIEDGVLILNYHEVFGMRETARIEDGLESYNVPVRTFEKQMKYLVDNDINILTVDEVNSYVSGDLQIEGKNVMITFDDIDQSVYTNAYPIMKKYNIPFSLFVVTGKAGTEDAEREYASWSMIHEMENSGLATVGLHTNNLHYKQNGQPVFLSDHNLDLFREDLITSIEAFEKECGYKPKYFAYPYGYGTADTDEALIENDIEMIFSLNGTVATDKSDRYYMPRFLIDKKNQRFAKMWLEG